MSRQCDGCGVPRWADCECYGPGAARREAEEAAAENCICNAGLGQRHVPLCEAVNSSPVDTAAPPQPSSPPAGEADDMSVAASGTPAAVGRLELGAPPDPAWLRQLAETLKLEAVLLEGHAETMRLPVSHRVLLAVSRMALASRALTLLADDLDAS